MPKTINPRLFARLAISVVMASLVAACATGPSPASDNNGAVATLSGELVYRQRIAMSPDAVIQLRLTDLDAGSIIAQRTIRPQGQQVPIPFELKYDAADFVSAHHYKLLATVHDGQNRLRWAADVPVGAGDHNDLRVRLAQAHFDNDAVIGARWALQRIVDANGSVSWARAKAPSWISFDIEDGVHGKAACNSFFGSYSLQDGGKIEIGGAGATLMACMGPSLANQFLQALSQVQRYALAGHHLYLITDNSTLVFERQQ